MTTQPTRNTNRNAAYLAALRLVKRLDPRPEENTPVKVGGRWCLTLDEAVRAILSAGQR